MASIGAEIVGRFLLLRRVGQLTAPLLRAWSPDRPDLPDCLAGARSAFLADLLVAEGHRRRGIGRTLVEDAVAIAHGCGAERLTLLVRADNAPARRLYETLGFTAPPHATATVEYSLSTGSLPAR